MQIITKSGFKCNIDKNVLNKYSFVKLMAKVNKDPFVITDIVTALLGKDEDKLMQHLGGDPLADDVANEVTEIIEKLKEDEDIKK